MGVRDGMLTAGEPVARKTLSAPETALCILLGLSVLFLTAWFLSWSGHGLDLTDESFYLNWIRDPHLYDFSASQFGFLYHYLFYPFHDDVVALRVANIVTTLGVGWVFGLFLLRPDIEIRSFGNRLALASAALALAFVALLPIDNWLPTPNYNSLTLAGLLLAATAMVALSREGARVASWPYVLLAFGGWLCFLGKPPSAALLAVTALAYLVVQGKAQLKGLVVAAGTSAGLLVLTALVTDGSIQGFADRMSYAASVATELDQRYEFLNLFRLDFPRFGADGEQYLLMATLVIFVVLTAYGAVSAGWRWIGFLVMFVLVLLGPAMALSTGTMPVVAWSPLLAMQILAVPLGILLALALSSALGRGVKPSRGLIVLSLLLAMLPYVYAFGTNNDYWRQAAGAGVFWVASALVLWRAVSASKAPRPIVLPALAASTVVVTAILLAGQNMPYRQLQPLHMAETSAVVGPARRQIMLSWDMAAYLEQLELLASEGGFRSGTPLVDLTGHYPGAAYALDAKAVGLPWIIGGYPGSDAMAARALARVSCSELAHAWVLVEPEGLRALPLSLMTGFGMRYEERGDLTTPLTSFRQRYRQVLLRPDHDVDAAIAACERQRDESR